MPNNFGMVTWLIAISFFILWVALHFGLGFILLRWLRLLQPASEHLNALVAEVSQKMNVPVRATWILSTFIGNAAAFPQTRQLIFTDKLLATLSVEETKAVCAHELGHLSEPRKVLAVRTLASFSFYPLIFAKPLCSLGDNGVSVYDLLIIGFLIVLAIGRRVARRMEQRADKIAVETQIDGAVYARALARLYEMNHTPAVMPNANKVHPDLYDRMVAAGVTPDFPKAGRAKKQSWTSILMVLCLVAIVLLTVFVNAWQQVWSGITVQIQ
jgi:Zn-dependent protease with chaperone function